jgi:plasmid stabilization system protein ParE
MKRPYVLTCSAASDLRSIVRYTREAWGEAQCRSYVAQIETTATELALGHGVYRNREDLLPGLRVRLSGHHYVFCLPRPGEAALILAILHERMDILARLGERLD